MRERFKAHPCYRPSNLNDDDLIDVLAAAATPSSHEVYLRFEPKECRKYAVRENPFVVFVVSALQLGLALYLVSWLIVLADLHSYPRDILTFAWTEWPEADRFVMTHWFSKVGQATLFS